MSSLLTTILANIPWGQVVESAPKIAQGAGRLWEKVRSRPEPPAEPGPGAGPGPAAAGLSPQEQLQQWQQQVASLQAQLRCLEGEMRTSAQLVKELAEQNARLVEQLQALQRRQARLALWCGAALVGFALWMTLLAWPA